MDGSQEFRIFETYISWIDAIVSLCRNLDQACSNLDRKFPSESNSGSLFSYIEIKREIGNHIDQIYYKDWVNYENINSNYDKSKQNFQTEIISTSNGKEINKITNIANFTGNSVNGRHNINKNEKEEYNKDGNKSYGLIIKGFKSEEIKNKKRVNIYNLESDIIKNLKVGEKMCLIKKNGASDKMMITKYTNDFDFLLDMPYQIEPNRDFGHHYESQVPGVYWDKRSWIASWYRGGRRYYKSFSSKLYGFHRSKYFAIHSRLSNSPVNYKHANKTKNSNYVF